MCLSVNNPKCTIYGFSCLKRASGQRKSYLLYVHNASGRSIRLYSLPFKPLHIYRILYRQLAKYLAFLHYQRVRTEKILAQDRHDRRCRGREASASYMDTWRGEKFSGNSSRAKLAKIYSALIKWPIQYTGNRYSL